MNIKKNIPNFITCCNLMSGCIGIVVAFKGQLSLASFCIYIGVLFDYLDGFAARFLKVTSELGKQLDSLSDMVTFGVLPSAIIYQILNALILKKSKTDTLFSDSFIETILNTSTEVLSVTTFFIAIFSAIRLAKFNTEDSQTTNFVGLPTPANASMIASFPFIFDIECVDATDGFLITPLYSILNIYTLSIFTMLSCYLLIMPLPMFSLKIKNFRWQDNKLQISFLAASIFFILLFKFTAIPVIIVLYIVVSLIRHLKKKN